MVNSYDDLMGSAMDPADHPAYGGHDDNYTPGRAGLTKTAGDVLPIPGEKSMGSGMDSRATDYALGKKTDPKVTPMPMSTTKGWAQRLQGMK